MDNLATVIIAALVIIPGIYFLVRSIRREALEGKCASCYQHSTCADGCCSADKKKQS
jgi:hypothetical protein